MILVSLVVCGLSDVMENELYEGASTITTGDDTLLSQMFISPTNFINGS